MTDLEFVERCVKEDMGIWEEFVSRYSRLIYGCIKRVIKSDQNQFSPEDIFQEIFLLLRKDDFKKLKSFKAKNGCSLSGWLKQVTINYAISYLRTRMPLISLDEEIEEGICFKDLLADPSILASEKIILQEQSVSLSDCISRLSPDERYFLELFLNRNLSLEELRKVLHVSRGVVDMRKSRILEKLKDCFKTKGLLLDLANSSVY